MGSEMCIRDSLKSLSIYLLRGLHKVGKLFSPAGHLVPIQLDIAETHINLRQAPTHPTQFQVFVLHITGAGSVCVCVHDAWMVFNKPISDPNSHLCVYATTVQSEITRELKNSFVRNR